MLSPDEKENILAHNDLLFSDSQRADIAKHRYKEEDCSKIIRLYHTAMINDIQLINVFDFDKGEDLETTIIRALLNCVCIFFGCFELFSYKMHSFFKKKIAQKSKSHKNLELTLYWKKVEIANSDIFNGKEKFTSEQLESIFEKALTLGNHQFVQLLIDNKFDIDKFVTVKQLGDLYNSSINSKDVKEAPFSNYFRKISKNQTSVKFNDVQTFIEEFTGIKLSDCFFSDPKLFATIYLFPEARIKNPVENLFIWSILFNRPEVARVFLKVSKVFKLC